MGKRPICYYHNIQAVGRNRRRVDYRMSTNFCIYCGSSVGIDPEYAAVAYALGQALAHHGVGLVYGGGRVGLMGIIANAVLESGGTAIGVIPEPLATREIAHDRLTELHVVANMHDRKALMARRANAFLTLPGGIGTFEEFFETLSWAALGLHKKPMGVLNVAGYFDPLLALLDHAVDQHFVRSEHLTLVHVATDPAAIVSDLLARIPAMSQTQPIDLGNAAVNTSR
jgi:uncharacterized protein (TIGR00730 family)